MTKHTVLVSGLFLAGALGLTPGLSKSRWRLKLDIGREKGTWMPSDWASSGARLFLGVDVEFTDSPVAQNRGKDPRQGLGLAESLVGPSSSTYRLKVNGDASFVGETGRQSVRFLDGGWCVQRRFEEPGAECLLRGWVDCASGATKRDVSVDAGERIFFTTGVWTDEAKLFELEAKRQALEIKMKQLKSEIGNTAESDVSSTDPLAVMRNVFRGAQELRNKTKKYEEYQKCAFRLNELFSMVPPPGDEPNSSNGISIASQGGLCVKRKKLVGEEYHILGRVSLSPITADSPTRLESQMPVDKSV